MSGTLEEFLLDRLRLAGLLREQDCAGVLDWWRKRRFGDESLAAFLAREQILTESAPVLLVAAWHGAMPLGEPSTWVRADAAARLQARENDGQADTDDNEQYIPQRTFEDDIFEWQDLRPIIDALYDPARLADEPSALETVVSQTETESQGEARVPEVSFGEAPERWPLPALLGNYRLTTRADGDSEVVLFSGQVEASGRGVAVRVCARTPDPWDADRRRQVGDQVQALGKMHHRHLAPVLDWFDDPHYPALVIPEIQGESLAGLIARLGRIPWPRALQFVRGAAEVLAAAAGVGVLHLRLHAGCLRITPDQSFKVEGVVPEPFRLPWMAMDRAGETLALAHAAPECFIAESRLDQRADLYGLGAIFYFALTGRPPFQGHDTVELAGKVTRDPITAPRLIEASIPAEVSAVVMRLLARRPQDRFASHGDLLGALWNLEALASRELGQV